MILPLSLILYCQRWDLSREAWHFRRGFAPEQRSAVAQLYWQAFGAKLNRILGPEPRALAYLERIIRTDHCISVSDCDGNLLAVAGFKTAQGSFAGGDRADMRAIYGLWGSYWRGFVLMLLVKSVENKRFLVDGIAVAPDVQSHGIGSALLQQLYIEGRARGYGEIRLEVVDSNPRAKALYERQGFQVIAEEKLGVLKPLFGFHCAYVMVRPI